MYYGHNKEPDADILFASVQTLSARENIEVFDPQRFDYIVIDEFHHAAADTYRRVIDYFEPKFMLGLTATPDRLDGVNLLALCEGNEVYRADIPKGIEEQALSPFHYYGLGDPTQYESIPWRRYTDEKLADLVGTEERAQHALDSLRRYTQSRVRALGFCVTQSHADFMADYFARHGVDCRAVYSGSEAPRTSTLEALANGEIEIVFCVDMFNEGLDVPMLDTVLMLRPTQSSIVWLQQLGRGLRYVKDKTLTVLDFIGNHAIFLRRPEILLSALRIESDRGKTPWREASYKALLPPGVEVTFDLEAQNVLETLRAEASKTGTKAERWYRAFRDQRGERPTAIQADEAGWFKQLSKKGGGWFAFVGAQGDLRAAENKVGEQLAEFFVELEKLPRTRSYKLLVLLALLHLGAFPGRARKRDICAAISARARKSAALMRDLSVDGRDPKEIEQLLDKDAFPRLAKLGKGRLFKNNTQYFDTTGLSTDEPDALASMTRELVELHLGRYLENANRSSTRLPPMLADDGSRIDARFDVERTGDATSIVFHSRGGKRGTQAERNSQYKEGLALLLSRLRQAHLTILRIEVDSDQVRRRGMTPKQRTLAIPDYAYPIAMKEVTDPLALARAIGTGAKRVGQRKGATGGNDTKRIRITLKEPVPAGELWGRLFRG
jgi:hypothetical protein